MKQKHSLNTPVFLYDKALTQDEVLEPMEHNPIETRGICTHVMQKDGNFQLSPLDRLGRVARGRV